MTDWKKVCIGHVLFYVAGLLVLFAGGTGPTLSNKDSWVLFWSVMLIVTPISCVIMLRPIFLNASRLKREALNTSALQELASLGIPPADDAGWTYESGYDCVHGPIMIRYGQLFVDGVSITIRSSRTEELIGQIWHGVVAKIKEKTERQALEKLADYQVQIRKSSPYRPSAKSGDDT